MSLEIKNLSFAYKQPDYKSILENFSVSFPTGTLCSIVGKNGSGKTTLLRLIAGLLAPNVKKNENIPTITVCRDEKVLFKTSPATWETELPKHASLVFQNFNCIIFPWQKVGQALNWVRPPFPKADYDTYKSTTLANFPTLNPPEVNGSFWNKLSGGQQQAVALARGLLRDPEILLLDEPVACIDPWYRHRLEEALLQANSAGREIRNTILVTHDLEEAVYLSDLIYVVDGPPLKVIGEPIKIKTPRTQRPYDFRLTEEFINTKRTLYQKMSDMHAL